MFFFALLGIFTPIFAEDGYIATAYFGSGSDFVTGYITVQNDFLMVNVNIRYRI